MPKLRRRRLFASVPDLSFIRSLTDDARELRWLRKMLLRLTLLMRQRIVERVVNALHRRYKKYTKRMVNPPSFLEWLDGHVYMHETYNYHSFDIRYYWSSRPVVLSSRYELSFDIRLDRNDQGDDSWFFEDLQHLINAKDPRDNQLLVVSKDFYEEEPLAEPKFELVEL